MPDPTNDDLNLSQEAFAEKFLGINGKSIVRDAGSINSNEWGQYWQVVRSTIETNEDLNWQDGDSDELKDLKARLKERAQAIFISFWALGQEERAKGVSEGEISRNTGSFVGEFDRIEEDIRGNEVIRIAQTTFGPDNLDPMNIRVSEAFSVNRLGSLRADTDAVVKLPRSITQISVDLMFAGVDAINDKVRGLRGLLANLMVSPVTTIESAFLTAALINHYSTPEIEQGIRQRVLQKADQGHLLDGFKDFGESITSNFEKLRELILTSDLRLEYYKQLILDRNQRVGVAGAAAGVTEDFNLPDIGVSIPVVLQDIVMSTDPVVPNALHVRLTFLRYNSSAFGIYGLEYKDGNGNRTPDIMQCTALAQYAEWAFLTPGAHDRGMYLQEYKAHLSHNAPDFKCTWGDLMNKKVPRSLETDAFVVESIQLSFAIKMVPLPLIGSKYPGVHIMGRSNVEASVTVKTTDRNAVAKFALMKDHLDAISRNQSGQFRDEQVTIENSVLNLVGASKFVITGCDMYPMEETSNGYAIDLNLIQAEYDYTGQQSLILQDQSVPDQAIRDLWERLWDLYQEFRRGSDTALSGIPLASPESKIAAGFLFGKEDYEYSFTPTVMRPQGVISPSLIVAACLRLFGSHGTTGPKAQDVNYATFEGVVRTYQQMFLTNGKLDANANNTSESQGGGKLLQFDMAPLPGRPGSAIQPDHMEYYKSTLGETVRKFLVGEGDHVMLGGMTDPHSGSGVETGTYFRFRDKLVGYGTRHMFGLTKEIWDQMLQVLLDAREAPDAVELVRENASKKADGKKAYDSSGLSYAVLNLQWLFTSGNITKFGFDLTKYLKESGEGPKVLNEELTPAQRRRLASNYPDMPLPTYGDLAMFRGERSVVNELGQSVPLWTRFAPTFSDLGIYPPSRADMTSKQTMFLIARDKDAVMEPAFWFHHERMREKMMARAEAGMQVKGQTFGDVAKEPLKVNVNVERVTGMPSSEAKQMLHEKIEDLLRDDSVLRDRIDKGKKKNEYFDVISSDGCAIGMYIPADRTAGNNEYKVVAFTGAKKYIGSIHTLGSKSFDRESEGHAKSLVLRAFKNVPDNTFSVARCFPTFRIYFVEWDDNRNRDSVDKLPMVGRKVRMIDDLYTSNAVIRFTVTDSKDDAAVAEVEILNTLGTFDTDSFLLQSEAKRLGIGQDDGDGTAVSGEDFLSRMRLQTGTGIVIQVGYSSAIDGLKTIFTGQITELEPGKILRFIAQGYKTELDQEVGIDVRNGNPREAINKLLRIGQDKKNVVPHLGRVFDSRDLNTDQLEEMFGSEATKTGTLGLQGPGGFISRTFGYTLNDVARNVWMDSNVGPDGFFKQAWQDLKETLTRDNPDNVGEMEYYFYNQTAWQGLQEMTRHLPGTICAVRPFDNEATCFFGYPDQPYQFRTPRGIEMWRWENITKAKRLESILGLERDLLNQFWGSTFGTTNSALTEVHFRQAMKKGNLADTGKVINSGGFLWLRKYLGGSTLGQNKGNPGFLESLSPSYTGFIKWTISLPRYEAGLGDLADFPDGRTAGINRIPIFESLGMDFTQDWSTIEGHDDGKQLARFIFAYFFHLRYTGGALPGSMEATWLELTRKGMGPLRNMDNSSNSNWEEFKRNFSGDGFDFNNGGLFPQRLKDVQDASFGDPQGALDAARKALDELLRAGIYTKEQVAEKLEVLSEYANGTKTLPGMDVVNPAFRRALDIGSENTTVSKTLLTSWPFFRIFVHYFASWMRKDIGSGVDSVLRKTATQQNLAVLDDTQLESWFKPFRDYHVVFAEHDIIDNSIVATTAEMSNSIMIRGHRNALSKPDDSYSTEDGVNVFHEDNTWMSWPNAEGVPFHPKLKRSSRKLGVAIEPNVNGMGRAAACLMTNMALGLRPMYRGEIKIVGRVMNPWDTVVVNDSYNMMFGVIEVERVTHEFSTETGWITTIVPHAYAHANNPWGLWQLAIVTSPLATVGTVIDVLSVVTAVWGIGLLIKGAWVAASAYAAARGVGTTAAVQVVDHATLRYISIAGINEVAEAAAARGLIAGVRGAGTYATGAGRWLAQNWVSTAYSIGKWYGGWGLVNAVTNPTIDFLFNMTVKMQITNTLIPVDFRPISYKGFPLTAGLDLTDEQIIPFGEKVQGVWSQIMEDFKGWFTTSVKNPGPPVGSALPPDRASGESRR